MEEKDVNLQLLTEEQERLLKEVLYNAHIFGALDATNYDFQDDKAEKESVDRFLASLGYKQYYYSRQ